jgi:hypothetical protein
MSNLSEGGWMGHRGKLGQPGCFPAGLAGYVGLVENPARMHLEDRVLVYDDKTVVFE